MLVLTWMSSNMADGNHATETSVTEFCYKSVNLFFDKLINIKVILFRYMNCLDSKFSEISFLTYKTALLYSLGRHVNAASRKNLEIQAYSITKPRTLLKRKFV